jgi:hypothetical protein
MFCLLIYIVQLSHYFFCDGYYFFLSLLGVLRTPLVLIVLSHVQLVGKKFYYLACAFCRWTSRDIGLKVSPHFRQDIVFISPPVSCHTGFHITFRQGSIYWNILPPPPRGRIAYVMGGKNMKRGREKGGKLKKRKHEKRKEERGKKKCKGEVKR